MLLIGQTAQEENSSGKFSALQVRKVLRSATTYFRKGLWEKSRLTNDFIVWFAFVFTELCDQLKSTGQITYGLNYESFCEKTFLALVPFNFYLIVPALDTFYMTFHA